jgi:hypothetical protein
LPARQPDNLVLPFVRPDVDIALPIPIVVRFVRVTMDGRIRITENDDTRVVE